MYFSLWRYLPPLLVFLCKFFPTCLVSNWNGWSNWGSCSKDCGGGSQSRSRTCPGNCVGGSASESRTCNSNQCGMLLIISITCKPALTFYLGKTEQFIHFCLLNVTYLVCNYNNKRQCFNWFGCSNPLQLPPRTWSF